MAYKVFEQKIRERFGSDVLRVYRQDGKHIATLSGGIKIVGNRFAVSVAVLWGNGHTANTTL